VRIALDDFGTGYATLTQLLSFHLDKLKIDRSFVSCLDQSEDSQVIVRAIVGIAKGFGLTTTAEGIEDAGQLAILKANGCAEGQGYLFSRAVPVAEIPALLSRTCRTLPLPLPETDLGATQNRTFGVGNSVESTRVKITDAGQQALA
jgi:EAL domain-containing protein (putative c-di-GMP-specific phosphodiesterase class I)